MAGPGAGGGVEIALAAAQDASRSLIEQAEGRAGRALVVGCASRSEAGMDAS
ncbi:hypothetical protein [Streptomyces sp. NPDC059063]|uniref:hypothetical protein n=1 Tax=unclassified Streptomyces TaxID=2593676 RepID=UPI00369226FF